MATLSLWEIAAQAFEPSRFPTPHSVQAVITPHEAANPPHLALIDEYMGRVLNGQTDRLLTSIAAQEGKSSRMVRAGVLWWLHHRPHDRVVIASFGATTAERWGRVIRNDIDAHPEFGLRISRDSRSAGRWQLEPKNGRAGGSVYCVGVGGALTGLPCDLMVIDDLVKGRAWVESQLYRDRQWDWWLNDARTRLGANSRVMGIGTRWHPDEVVGRLQEHEPGRWTTLNIPALAEENDPLGRAVGEPLQSVRGKGLKWYLETKDSVGPYVWDSLYQGHPTPSEGGLFKRSDLRYYERPDAAANRRLQASAAPGEVFLLDGKPVWLRDCYLFATVDLAASTKTSADFTVACMWAHTTDGHLLLLDMVRARVEDTQHGNLILPLVRRWNPDFVGVEDSGRSVNLSAELGAAGVPVRPLKADADKVTRALPATARVARHQLWLPRDENAPWVDTVIGEMLAFANGNRDDIVDNVAYASRIVLGSNASAFGVRLPSQPGGDFLADLGPAPTRTVGGRGMLDFSRVQF